MKKNRLLFFLLTFIFVLPIFAFSCNEVSFDDVNYLLSGKTAQEVIESLNSARLQTISNEIKMKLSTTSSYKFYTVSDESITNKNTQIKSTFFLGKDRDSNIFSSEELFYENKILVSSTNQTYEKQTTNYTTSAYVYTMEKFYNEGKENNISNVNYLRESFDYSPNTTLTNLYSNIVKRINANEFDTIYEKAYNGETYYKLVANVNGLENIKDKFFVNSSLFIKPELFFKNKSTDFVPEFSCEFGLREASGTIYITYFKLEYSIFNSRYEKYLDVSSKTTLDQYGDSVVVNGVDDRGEYVANTFVNLMNNTNSYCIFNKVDENGTIEETSYTVLKIAKHLENEYIKLDVFDYSIKIHSMQDNYYCVLSQLNANGGVEYKIYKITDVDQRVVEEITEGFNFYLNNFDFSVKYESKNTEESYYTFGSNSNAIKVYTSPLSEVTQIEKSINNQSTKLNIESYGINNSNLDVIYDFSNYFN